MVQRPAWPGFSHDFFDIEAAHDRPDISRRGESINIEKEDGGNKLVWLEKH